MLYLDCFKSYTEISQNRSGEIMSKFLPHNTLDKEKN